MKTLIITLGILSVASYNAVAQNPYQTPQATPPPAVQSLQPQQQQLQQQQQMQQQQIQSQPQNQPVTPHTTGTPQAPNYYQNNSMYNNNSMQYNKGGNNANSNGPQGNGVYYDRTKDNTGGNTNGNAGGIYDPTSTTR